jgi:drug/metabolite transporter (DMT)-like permease
MLFHDMQMTLYFIYPAITVVMAWLVHGEAATWLSAAGCGISLLGVAFIARPPFLFGGTVQYDVQHWLGMSPTQLWQQQHASPEWLQ